MTSGAVAYGHGEFERADGLLTRAARAAATAEAPVRLAAGALQVRALAAVGPRSAARGALKLRAVRAEVAREDSGVMPEFLNVAVADTEARVLIAAGEIDSAREVLEQARAEQPRSMALLVRQATMELHAQEINAAGATLAEALPAPGSEPPAVDAPDLSCSKVIEAWVLRAMLDRAAGERKAAADALEHALALAEDEEFIQDPSPTAVRELLEHQAHIGTAHPALVEVLLDAMTEGRSPHGEALAEPLTAREQRILGYLPTMLSNAEIGAETFVSLNTVKTHLRSIYRKLGVSSRAEAVEKARRLGLLPAGIRRPRAIRRT